MPLMEIHVAVAKVGKYASVESGDSFEMIERPHGGLSFVLVDGQRSGQSAKAVSNLVARKAISLMADGVRDGAAARAAHDYLYTHRRGQVSATLNMLSVDLESNSIRLACNNPVPAYVLNHSGLEAVGEGSEPVGVRRVTKPVIKEYPLSGGMACVVYTDGLSHAGDRRGAHLDIAAALQLLAREAPGDARRWADDLLAEALRLDEGRPSDDISVLVVAVREGRRDEVRRLWVSLPI